MDIICLDVNRLHFVLQDWNLYDCNLVCISQQTHGIQATLPFGRDLVMSEITLHNGCDNVTSQFWGMTYRQHCDVTSSGRTLMVTK